MDQDDRDPQHQRRDVIVAGALSFAGVGVLLAFWPFVHHGNPNPGTQRPDLPEVDLLSILPGQTLKVAWQNKPILIRHRTTAEINSARDAGLPTLVDKLARNSVLPSNTLALDTNRTTAGHGQWLVVVAVCTRGDCLVTPRSDLDAAFICACCGSRYDTSGRVRGGPAPENLPVPRMTFLSPTRLQIG